MLSSSLSYIHQTHDMINVYHVTIFFYPYPVHYRIMSVFYNAHQTDSDPGYSTIFSFRGEVLTIDHIGIYDLFISIVFYLENS